MIKLLISVLNLLRSTVTHSSSKLHMKRSARSTMLIILPGITHLNRVKRYLASFLVTMKNMVENGQLQELSSRFLMYSRLYLVRKRLRSMISVKLRKSRRLYIWIRTKTFLRVNMTITSLERSVYSVQ